MPGLGLTKHAPQPRTPNTRTPVKSPEVIHREDFVLTVDPLLRRKQMAPGNARMYDLQRGTQKVPDRQAIRGQWSRSG